MSRNNVDGKLSLLTASDAPGVCDDFMATDSTRKSLNVQRPGSALNGEILKQAILPIPKRMRFTNSHHNFHQQA